MCSYCKTDWSKKPESNLVACSGASCWGLQLSRHGEGGLGCLSLVITDLSIHFCSNVVIILVFWPISIFLVKC